MIHDPPVARGQLNVPLARRRHRQLTKHRVKKEHITFGDVFRELGVLGRSAGCR